MERVARVELASSGWRPEALAAIPRPQTWCTRRDLNSDLPLIGRRSCRWTTSTWCAVGESNSHLLFVRQRFLSIELPARNRGQTRTVIPGSGDLCPVQLDDAVKLGQPARTRIGNCALGEHRDVQFHHGLMEHLR